MTKQLEPTITTLLLGAAEAIRTRGHARNVYMDARGAVCMRGALDVAGAQLGSRAEREACARIAAVLGEPVLRLADGDVDALVVNVVSTWNDRHTGDEAIALLERAAQIEGA